MAFSTTTDASVDVMAQKRLECLESLNETADTTVSGIYCPGTWDGWLCWPDTAAGTSAYALCPEFITGFDPRRFAHKLCEENGEWFRHPQTNRSWSNYTTCINIDDFEWRRQVNLIYETGYCISLIAILLSLAILSYFRSLKCARITLHMNLFASFACNNFLWLLWYRLVLTDLDLLQQSGPSCITLHLVLHYFLLSNYSWMLCEGFYLHTVLVSAFVSEKKLLKWLLALGWGSPIFFIVLYGFLRGYVSPPTDTIECWMNDSAFNKVFIVPVCSSMLLNLVFLFNIMRVLLLKLKAPAGPQGAGPSRTVLQAFRATLLLVPLLGLQYILTPFRPRNGHPFERTYETILASTSSFQGLFVAILFCFLNGEVIAQVKRKWRTVFLRTRANSYTATQVSFVRCGPPVPGEEKSATKSTFIGGSGRKPWKNRSNKRKHSLLLAPEVEAIATQSHPLPPPIVDTSTIHRPNGQPTVDGSVPAATATSTTNPPQRMASPSTDVGRGSNVPTAQRVHFRPEPVADLPPDGKRLVTFIDTDTALGGVGRNGKRPHGPVNGFHRTVAEHKVNGGAIGDGGAVDELVDDDDDDDDEVPADEVL
ncbi:calcitonin gene-related peptide type 1 receptor isoform X2 [Anopheles darlingi]|uniref:calcitonin gene-related peptide type 1 receptor isoform X2 n=1 Tax=Anopheles darlingi TaxID=43151 RepID=UPI0021006448|nr:calcitonin gene-related peptide type 1 receptor isoform X2 [Anopheles darlingi]